MPRRNVIVAIMAAAAFVIGLACQDVASQSQTPFARRAASVASAAATGRLARPGASRNWKGIWSSGYIETPARTARRSRRPGVPDRRGGAQGARDGWPGQQDHSTGGTANTAPRPGDTGTYNSVFSGRGRDVIRTRRTSQVIDPKDGKIPWKPEVREQRGQGSVHEHRYPGARSR